MQKIFPVLLIALFVAAGCSSVAKNVTSTGEAVVKAPVKVVTAVTDPVASSVNKIISPATGYLLFLTVMELNTNVSSLFIDKTKEKVASYQSVTVKKLIPGSFLYILPPKITDSQGKYRYDSDMQRLLRNYMAVGKYGIPVEDMRQAEYIVVINIKESLERNFGTNTSEVAFSIMDKMDYPVYAATVVMESKSDSNFWYHPSKTAMPVNQLTTKALGYVMTYSLPEANGDPQDMKSSVEKYLAKFSKDKEQ